MKDRSVEYPNRYRMTLVPGTADIYEMTPVPGEVYEEGTLMSKGNILDDNSEMDIWGTIGDRTPNNAFSFIGKSLAAHDEDIANLAATLERKIVTGTYVGDGTEKRTISIGFTPTLVLVSSIIISSSYCSSAIVMQGQTADDRDGNEVIAIVDGGFRVSTVSGGDSYSARINNSGATYNYIAIS